MKRAARRAAFDGEIADGTPVPVTDARKIARNCYGELPCARGYVQSDFIEKLGDRAWSFSFDRE